MTQEELIQHLETSRQTFTAALESLTPADYTQPGFLGEWTIKDLLVHLTLWEAQLVTLLFQLENKRTPSTVHFSGESDDAINARWFAAHQTRPLDRVLADFEAVRQQTMLRLENFSDQDLNDPHRYPALKGRPLWQWVVESTSAHEADHLPALQTWIAAKP